MYTYHNMIAKVAASINVLDSQITEEGNTPPYSPPQIIPAHQQEATSLTRMSVQSLQLIPGAAVLNLIPQFQKGRRSLQPTHFTIVVVKLDTMVPPPLNIQCCQVLPDGVGHHKQFLCQLSIKKLARHAFFSGSSKQPSEQRVDAALLQQAIRSEERSVKGEVALRNRQEGFVEAEEDGLHQGVAEAECCGGKLVDDGGVDVGVVAAIASHHAHAFGAQDLG